MYPYFIKLWEFVHFKLCFGVQGIQAFEFWKLFTGWKLIFHYSNHKSVYINSVVGAIAQPLKFLNMLWLNTSMTDCRTILIYVRFCSEMLLKPRASLMLSFVRSANPPNPLLKDLCMYTYSQITLVVSKIFRIGF